MSSEPIEQTFSVGSPARLKLSNISGSVEIMPGEPGVLTVKAIKHAENGDAGRTKIEISQAEDGLVRVETRFQDAWWGFFSFTKPCKVDYQVLIPPSCEIDASCVSSSLKVRGLEGKIKLSTVSGELGAEDVTGEMKVSSVSGEISGNRLSGNLHLNTVSGEVRLLDSKLPSADLTTVSGEMRLQTALSDGPYRFHSVSGSIWLSVPTETHCSLNLQSVSGRIHVRLPVTRQKLGGGHSSMDVQGGGVQVSVNSVSGNLYVENPETAAQADIDVEERTEHIVPPIPPIPPIPSIPPIPPIPPVPPVQSEPLLDRATILDRIEKGEMTVEEGLKALEKLS